ncbi:MAG: OmpA family protein [Paracoccaceae bacterium]|nr:MAG: OmpA family protein [Paracoccaceae bacterium]
MTRRIRSAARIAILALACGQAGPAHAIDLAFPGPARITALAQEPAGSVDVPVGPWIAGALPTRAAEGRVERRAWRVETPGLSTLALMAPLRDQIAAAGFTAIYECDTRACGGFDFRYAADLLPEPEMHVDLGDFRYLAAERGPEMLALIVSRSALAGFVQVTRVRPRGADAAPDTTLLLADAGTPRFAPDPGGTPAGPQAAPGAAVSLSGSNAPSDMPARVMADLETHGRAVLDDLVFDSGATRLADGDYGSLAALADWLRADPSRHVALVGHTDASGGLDTNIVISRRRADAVRAELIGTHGIPASQVSAEGVGYLSPRASNATDEGRQANRRVEAVITTTP